MKERGWIRQVIDAFFYGTLLAILSRLPKPPSRAAQVKRTWMARLFEAALLFGALALTGLLVMVSGIVPIKASSGHWAITKWFLEFSMARSFATHSLGVKTPALEDPAMALKGATQYETACRPCHGSPELHHPRIAAAMTAQPPYLAQEVHKWKPAELFTIVKHGVKFTGMPAWPTQVRDDEVWAMVAFLRLLPSLDQGQYNRLARGAGDPGAAAAPLEELSAVEQVPRAVRDRCTRCHGVEGRGRGLGAFPKLAGQHAQYLYASMRAFESGRRHSGIMEPVAAGLTDEEMREAARHYASRSAGGASRPLDPAAVGRGRAIALLGIPSQRVPACADCHGPRSTPRRHDYPRLAGQYADYILLQLTLFKEGRRGGTAFAHLMQEVAPKLSEHQMRDVALFYESLGR